MNPTLHKPVALEASVCPDGTYLLHLQYRRGGSWQTFTSVHVPPVLATALSSDAESLHLETLQVNGYPQYCLPSAPDYLLIGVQTRDGVQHSHVPAQFTRARRKRFWRGLALCAAGLVALPWHPLAAAVGALLLVFGSHEVRTSQEFACRPFHVNTVVS